MKDVNYYIKDFETSSQEYDKFYIFLKEYKVEMIKSNKHIQCSKNDYKTKYKNIYICSGEKIDIVNNKESLDFYIKMDAEILYKHFDNIDNYRIWLESSAGYPKNFLDIYPEDYNYETGTKITEETSYGRCEITSTKLNSNWYYNEENFIHYE
ncbi:MAG: hypothetical protein IKQ29_03850 [Bacilli bacterium]|nr:hypothetical protein [Bacilli bacterium]